MKNILISVYTATTDYGSRIWRDTIEQYQSDQTAMAKQLFLWRNIFSPVSIINHTDLTLGGGWTEYDGRHYGNIIWAQEGGIQPDYEYYNKPAKKTDFNVYSKWQQQLGKMVYKFC